MSSSETPTDKSSLKTASEMRGYTRKKLRSLSAVKWGPRAGLSEPRA